MKKGTLILLAFGVLIFFWCDNKKSAVEYNDQLIQIIEHCTSSEKTMYQAISDNSSISLVSASVDEAIKNCKESQSEANDLDDFDGETTFRDAIRDLLNLELHYLWLIEESLVYYDIKTMTEDQKSAYQLLSSNIEEDETKSYSLIQQVTQEQENFAQKYDFSLEN